MQYRENNKIEVRVEVLRNGGVYTTLTPVRPVEVECAADSELKMSMRGTFLPVGERELPDSTSMQKGILWATDRIRPVLIVNGEEYPVGRYIATTPCEKRENGVTVWEIEAYSVLYLASRVCVEENYRISAGTNYIAAIQGLLRSAGITEYEADATTLVLAADRADWTVGTPVLRIVNALLTEINYDPAWVDLKGKVHLTKYKAPSMDAIDHIYNAGQNSIIEDVYTVSSDYFDKANVFRCVCTSPDLDAPLSAEAENNDENSPFSTVSMGIRILDYEEVESVPDLATLQERVQNKLTKSLQAKEEITFVTALAPEHGVYDTVAVGLDGVTGIYRETAWSMTLDASGNMRHTAERVVLQ